MGYIERLKEWDAKGRKAPWGEVTDAQIWAEFVHHDIALPCIRFIQRLAYFVKDADCVLDGELFFCMMKDVCPDVEGMEMDENGVILYANGKKALFLDRYKVEFVQKLFNRIPNDRYGECGNEEDNG